MTGLIKGLQPYSPHWKNHGTGGGTSFTLDVSSTTTATILIVGGVIQLAGTDYTVSGTTVTTTTSVTSGVEVISAVLYNLGSVTTPAAGSVNFASLGFTSQAQGDLLVRGASSWARLPAGTSGQFLKTQGAGADPTWATPTAGGLRLIGTQVADASSALTQTGLDSSTYDTFLVQIAKFKLSATSFMRLQMGDSSGLDTGSSDYKTTVANHGPNAGTDEQHTANAVYMMATTSEDAVYNNAKDYLQSTFVINAAPYPFVSGDIAYGVNGNVPALQSFIGYRDASITIDRISIFPSAGNITSGRMTVWGMAHA